MQSNPKEPSPCLGWYRLYQILAFLGVAVASFELGILWSSRGATRPVPVAAAAGGKAPEAASARASAPTSSIEVVSIRAEFNPQSALLLGANELVWHHQQVFTDMVKALHNRLPIIGIVNDENEIELGQQLLNQAGLPPTAVSFIKHPLDSMWLRDFGPLFSRWSDGRVEVIDAIYRNPDERGQRNRDDAFSDYIGQVLGLPVRKMPLVIEGGNLISNGDGIMVTTSKVISQSDGLPLEQIGRMLKEYLGCRLWVYVQPLQGEPTGHIDFSVTFLRRNLAVVGRIDPSYDPTNAAILDSIANRLTGQPTSMGPLKVERIPMPPRTAQGNWRSYNNILLCNGVLLLPSYSDVDPKIETEVMETYKRLVPGLEIVTINCDSLVRNRGVLHCIGITIPGYVNVRPLLGESVE